MGKSSTGPDWIDVATYARQIEEHHKVSIAVLITPATSSGGIPLSCVVLATQDKLVSVMDGKGWSSSGLWPSRHNRTIEGCFYGLLMRVDEVLSAERWEQETLPA